MSFIIMILDKTYQNTDIINATLTIGRIIDFIMKFISSIDFLPQPPGLVRKHIYGLINRVAPLILNNNCWTISHASAEVITDHSPSDA